MRVVYSLPALLMAGVCLAGFTAPHFRPMTNAELSVFYRMIADMSGGVFVVTMLVTVVYVVWRR